MIFIVLYVIVGVVMDMIVNSVLDEHDKSEKKDLLGLLVDISINMTIILLWPLFVLIFIRSCIKYKENEK